VEINHENIKISILKISKLFGNAIRINDVFIISLKNFNIIYNKENSQFIEFEKEFYDCLNKLITDDYLYFNELQNFLEKSEIIIWIGEKGIEYLEIEEDFNSLCKQWNLKENLDIQLNVMKKKEKIQKKNLE